MDDDCPYCKLGLPDSVNEVLNDLAAIIGISDALYGPASIAFEDHALDDVTLIAAIRYCDAALASCDYDPYNQYGDDRDRFVCEESRYALVALLDIPEPIRDPFAKSATQDEIED